MSANINTLAELRLRLREADGGFGDAASRPYVSTGIDALDGALPGGGLPGGSLVEIFYSNFTKNFSGGGAATLACLAARAAAHSPVLTNSRWVAWIDTGDLYPPAAAALGLDPSRLLVIRPRGANSAEWAAQALWAFEQTARCRSVAASIMILQKIPLSVTRRLQLSAEAGGGLALLLRPAGESAQPSAAPVRMDVRTEVSNSNMLTIEGARSDRADLYHDPFIFPPQRLVVEILKAKGAVTNATIYLDMNHANGDVRGAAAPADRSDFALRRTAPA